MQITYFILMVLMAFAVLFVAGYPVYLLWHFKKYGKFPKRIDWRG